MVITREILETISSPDFLVDIIIRDNGRLVGVTQSIHWAEAVERAITAFDGGFGVEIEETVEF